MTSFATYATVPTQFLNVDGVSYAYRTLGRPNGVPIIYFNHLAANLDNCDPRIMDGLAAHHQITAFDYQGVGASGGWVAGSIADMATDAIAFIKALGHEQVDILGFSLGGFVAQEVLLQAPELVRRLVLAGTGPRGGQGISRVARLTYLDMLRWLLTLRDPKFYLFFTRTKAGKEAAQQFLRRLKERKTNRDKAVGVGALLGQLKAITAWGRLAPADLSPFRLPVLVVNGDHDRMVPTPNSVELARRFPNAELVIYPDAGHGGTFQNHAAFVPKALAFFGA